MTGRVSTINDIIRGNSQVKAKLTSSNRSRRQFLKALIVASFLPGAFVGAAHAQPVEINFWDMIWGPAEYAAVAQKLVDKFNASQNDIKVVYRSVPWDSWYQTYVTAIASGSAPDISTGGSFQAVQFYSMDEIYPVDELIEEMKKDGSLSDFSQSALDTVRYHDHYVALPWGNDIRAYLYRKDILAANGVAAPSTWEEFRAAAKKVTKNGVFGLVCSGDQNGFQLMVTAAVNNGGGLFDPDRKPAITGERAREALQFVSSLVKDGSVNPASAGYSYDDSAASFMRGESAFFLDNPNVTNSDNAPKDKIGILPPLKGPHGDLGTFNGANNIMVYKQSKHPKETLKFLRWWSENQLPLWTEGHAGNLPVRASLLKDPYFQNNPILKYTADNYIPIGKSLGAAASGTFPQLNVVDGDGFLNSLAQRIFQGEDPQGPAQDAQAYLKGIMSK